MIPGLYRDIPIEEYHGSSESVSKSGLDHIAQSPATYYGLHLDPRRPPQERKGGQLEGSLAHCATLEPAEFSKRYAVGPAVNRNTKDWKVFCADLPEGVVAIQQDQRDVAFAQANSIRSLPQVGEAFSNGWAEESAYWIDPETGILCRCRPDWVYDLGSAGRILIDVKTYSDVSPAEFRRQIARKRYHVQRSWYGDGYQIAGDVEVLEFIFIAVEASWPYLASAITIDVEATTQGRVEYRRDLNTLASCRASNSWPGYDGVIHTVSLPRWALDL